MRRGTAGTVRYRRAMILLASAGGNTVAVIARLVAADEDTVRDVIHRFNEIGLACPDPQRAGGRPRLLSSDDEAFIAQTATTRPAKLGRPFTRWSIRKLLDYLRRLPGRALTLGRETLRTLPARHSITFQRTKTWTSTPNSTQSSTPSPTGPSAPSSSTSSAPWASGPPPGRAGHHNANRTGCRPPTTAPRASPTSTVAMRSAMTCCGASTGPAKASTPPGPP
ncbi:hypothetical protein GCM10017559_59490 [Streptosporangium longisporum]|uniref:Transposase n=1 Tax=Streptosporangium longisporum TaxID=46187 RepID=A0ABN3YD64_9ACTN